MSNAAITWSVGLHPGPGPKSVLFCLADRATDHSGEDWTCFPSVKDICNFTDFSARTVERHLHHLWREGVISRKRRRRADGLLGIYDFTLHRDADRRAALKLAREKVQDFEAAMENGDDRPVNLSGGPPVNLTCGPPDNLSETTRQIGSENYDKLTGQEPLLEPSKEPSIASAREPGDHGFDVVIDLWPESGRKRTKWAEARAAWAFACGLETAGRLTAAITACAADPEIARGDHGWPGLQNWLSEERWRSWLPKAVTPAEAVARTPFVGPPEVLAAIVQLAGQGAADAYLTAATWREADRTVLTRTQLAADRLTEAIPRADLAKLDLRFARAPQTVDPS